MWKEYRKIRRFMDKDSVEKIVGPAKCQIEDRLLYYYGDGFFLAFTPRKFKIENLNREEYGEEGLYFLSVLHFSDIGFLKKYLRIDKFEAKDVKRFEDDIVTGYVNYMTSYSDVRKAYKRSGESTYYTEGEKRSLQGSEFVFSNLFIQWDPFIFFFAEKSNKSTISGFEYTPFE